MATMRSLLSCLVIVLVSCTHQSTSQRYEPTWESLDSRPLPAWYDEGKLGIFIHWGVFSVPSFEEWFWYNWETGSPAFVEFMTKNYPPNFTYQEFAPEFTASFYNASKWANLFQKSGAKYVVLTSKHHEGYTLWPSKYSFGWNAMDVGPKKDLLAELASAIRADTNLRFGIYHSRYEWFNPLYESDKAAEFWTNEFVDLKTLPELYEVVNAYQPEVIWSDGDWEASDDYWKSKEFLTWLYNDSPVKDTVVTNDRWGNNTWCTHGGFHNCADGFNPGILYPHKWENCHTLDKKAWAYRRNAQIEDYITPEELLTTFVKTVSCGGNLLLNVGPTKEGVIVPIQEERLLQLGEWMNINSRAIYESSPWTTQEDPATPGLWYTYNAARKQVYAILLSWPGQEQVYLSPVDPTLVGSVELFGYEGELQWSSGAEGGINVIFPRPDQVQSKWAWTIVLNLK